MKRLFSIALFGVAATVLSGCPVYSDSPDSNRVCDGNTCWNCPTGDIPTAYASQQCSAWACNTNNDCPGEYYCGTNGTCVGPGAAEDAGVAPPPDATTSTPVPGACTQPSDCGAGYTCGAGGVCELGDCSVTGCTSGYVCELENGALQCLTQSSTPDAATADSGVACQSNGDCANSSTGALCLDGTCVASANQCFDGTQCAPGDKCVQGACTPSCSSSSDAGASVSCPTGYACTDLVEDASSSGVCSGNTTPCETNPAVCATGTVCSQNHCVALCSASSCAAGEVCIQGGCVPNQLPTFTCTQDGVQDVCAAGSLCIHHSCYLACSPDAGAAACQSDEQFDECKPVTASTGTYYVCGSSTNLGTQCNPTSGLACTSSAAVCVDGFCY